MKKLLLYKIIMFSLVLCSPAAASEYQVSRRYSDDGMFKDFGANIILVGSPEHVIKLTRWLDQIAMIPKGHATLWTISESPHELTVKSSKHSLVSAGRTIAPMTMNLINGVGESVQIIFDARLDDRGSHMVFNAKQELIEYSAVQNLYHGLAHAMHQMNGTWRYFSSEAQAIEEENIFREQMASLQGRLPTRRYRKDGVLIGSVRHQKLLRWYEFP